MPTPQLEQVEAAVAEKKAQTATVHMPVSAIPTASANKKLSYKEKREYEQLEQQIPKLETEKATLEKQLYSSPNGDFSQLQTLTEKLAELSQSIDHKTERWLELAERL